MSTPTIVDPEHINVMLWCGLILEEAQGSPVQWPVFDTDGQLRHFDVLELHVANEVGQMLLDTNARARKANTGADDAYFYSYTEPRHGTWSIVEILKAVEFYESQTLHVPDWFGCDAFFFCQALRARAAMQLPGYLGATYHLTAGILPAQERDLPHGWAATG
ncbi:hypothetical protein NJBCHELONAE_43820 [Mycobacteroides chelonae]|uniref:hypothetical protein n=1 Tax=Mycobacteroides chelonae TaxID=1774 RepID=UPI0021DDFC6F|nr:hypothetical protein [Mycobacteroides chelonae]GLE59071.1 hypothetical protein NJBCHELONAE_43820 [Mycobacteroides chelonae]